MSNVSIACAMLAVADVCSLQSTFAQTGRPNQDEPSFDAMQEEPVISCLCVAPPTAERAAYRFWPDTLLSGDGGAGSLPLYGDAHSSRAVEQGGDTLR